jgi:hypothetical protein
MKLVIENKSGSALQADAGVPNQNRTPAHSQAHVTIGSYTATSKNF